MTGSLVTMTPFEGVDGRGEIRGDSVSVALGDSNLCFQVFFFILPGLIGNGISTSAGLVLPEMLGSASSPKIFFLASKYAFSLSFMVLACAAALSDPEVFDELDAALVGRLRIFKEGM